MLEVCRIPARWPGYILGGFILLVTGIVCLLFTQAVMGIILVLFSAMALITGIFLIIASIFIIGFRLQWIPLFILGIIFVIIGLFSVYYPALVAAIAIYLIAGLSLLIGVLAIAYGAISFVELKTRVLIIFLGIIPVIIAIYMFLNPSSAASLIVQLWGIFGCILGTALMIQGLILWNVSRALGCGAEDTR